MSEVAESGLGNAWSAFASYLSTSETHAAVVVPLILSIVFLARERCDRGTLQMMRVAFWASLPVMYATATWVVTPEVRQLHVLTVFTFVCLYLVWRRVYVPPLLAFAYCFFAHVLVDIAQAFVYALRNELPLVDFYQGVGGAGVLDGLLLFPVLTALVIRYGLWRQGDRLGAEPGLSDAGIVVRPRPALSR